MASAVIGLSRSWTEWHSGSFYTLGCGIYLFPENSDLYFDRAQQNNHILWSSFSDLYCLLLECLSATLGDRVAFHWRLALPGFHIFDFSNVKKFSGGGPHVDFQFNHFANIISQDEMLEHITVILPIRLPKFGSGLDVWNLTAANLQGDQSGVCVEESLNNSARIYIPYKPGKLIIFSSQLHHRMAPVSACLNGDRRITLQCHCARSKTGWVLYW